MGGKKRLLNVSDPPTAATGEEAGVTLSPVVLGNNNLLPPKHKLIKEQKNLERRQDGRPTGQPVTQPCSPEDREAEKEMHRWTDEEEEKSRPDNAQHTVTVSVEMNIDEKEEIGDRGTPPAATPIKRSSKRKSTTPQRRRRKQCTDGEATETPPSDGAVAGSVHQTPALVSSPSQFSIMSETAAEELCDLRNYYSKQLRRINYVSHECLRQHPEPGVLACIREPLRSLRLPRSEAIAQTARSLWTRVSGRRKLVHR